MKISRSNEFSFKNYQNSKYNYKISTTAKLV